MCIIYLYVCACVLFIYVYAHAYIYLCIHAYVLFIMCIMAHCGGQRTMFKSQVSPFHQVDPSDGIQVFRRGGRHLDC